MKVRSTNPVTSPHSRCAAALEPLIPKHGGCRHLESHAVHASHAGSGAVTGLDDVGKAQPQMWNLVERMLEFRVQLLGMSVEE
jgi:hypothetical protein